jgi:hypothetical protein
MIGADGELLIRDVWQASLALGVVAPTRELTARSEGAAMRVSEAYL